MPRPAAEGNILDPGWRGVEQNGQAEISCWESYQRASGQAPRNVMIMRDMVARVFGTGAGIPILDVYGSTASPTANGTLLRAEAIQEAAVGPDQNPDIVRRRMLVEYRWLERITAG